jgi:uncharacterized phage infection (PIP) family protein YhgE
MSDKKVITLNEFKTVIEGVNSNIKKLSEVMVHNFSVVKEQIAVLQEGQTELRSGQAVLRKDVTSLQEGQNALRKDVTSLQEGQNALRKDVKELQEGQVEIKNMLSQKVDRSEFTRLEKRVIRLEHKIA